MNFYTRGFNLYLLPLVLGLLFLGCAHSKKDKEVGILRIHIESETAGAGGKTITVMRSEPVSIGIVNEPILTEANLVSARLLEAPGGCAIELKFDNAGGWSLEQFTAINPGKHLVIFGQWGEKVEQGRWLAAPLIAHRMGTGMLVFTPDASHEEAEKLVKGLTAYIKKHSDKSK